MSNPPDEAGERESNESSGVRGECTVIMLEKWTCFFSPLAGFKVKAFAGISRRARQIFVCVAGWGGKGKEVEVYKKRVL